MAEKLTSKEIDHIINIHKGWKGALLAKLRKLIRQAVPDIKEDVKWKVPSRPEGNATWYSNGIVCIVEIWKEKVNLIFFKGAKLEDSNNLFNARLKSKTDRAIEFRENDPVKEKEITDLIKEAVKLNSE